MSAMELLCITMGIDPVKLSKEEILILEGELYSRICEEITESYKVQYKNYFHVFKFNTEMENTMSDDNFFRSLINDLLKSEAYTISGIAQYTQTPEDIIQDLLIGCNTNPILTLPRKIIELHRLTRPEIYKSILKKIISDQVTAA